MNCRNCGQPLDRVFADLGTSPLSNAYLSEPELDEAEPRFPLRPHICEYCLLVQLPVFEAPAKIFQDYAFFSGQSRTWQIHCGQLAEGLLDTWRDARVLEIASNDGTFVREAMRWTPNVCGIEPARNVARQALLHGLPTIDEFFTAELGYQLAAEGYQADVIVANNVLAHVPDLDDFLAGVRYALHADGLMSVEVPDVWALVDDNQFDTIYHEHFSYFCLQSLCSAMARRGLAVTDVQRLPFHGGSLRATVRHAEHARPTEALHAALEAEADRGPGDLFAYAGQPAALKQRVREMIDALKHEGRTIAGYGAPAKACTFLAYCGIDRDEIDFIVDSTPAKQGRYLPGARIPILAPEALVDRLPDVVMILPWNWQSEILGKIDSACAGYAPMVICRDEILRDGALAAAA